MLVLVTRPREQAAETTRLLREAGHEVLVDPVLKILRLPCPPVPEGIAAVAITSGNAAEALAGLPPALPVFAVGEGTARAVRAAGRTPVGVAGGDGTALADLIRATVPAPARILHLCGRDVREGLQRDLTAAGYAYQPLVVYEAVPAAGLAPEVAGALRDGRLGAGLFFSPRSAAIWAELARADGVADQVRGMIAACLSEAVAAELAGLPFAAVRVAASRDQRALLRCLEGRG